jgi:hypothetical protein
MANRDPRLKEGTGPEEPAHAGAGGLHPGGLSGQSGGELHSRTELGSRNTKNGEPNAVGESESGVIRDILYAQG